MTEDNTMESDQIKDVFEDNSMTKNQEDDEVEKNFNNAMKEKINKLKKTLELKSQAIEVLRKSKTELFCQIQSLTNTPFSSSHELTDMLNSCTENLVAINSKRSASESNMEQQFQLMDASLKHLTKQLALAKDFKVMTKNQIDKAIKDCENEIEWHKKEEKSLYEKQIQKSVKMENFLKTSEVNFWKKIHNEQAEIIKTNQAIIDDLHHNIEVYKKKVENIETDQLIVLLKSQRDELETKVKNKTDAVDSSTSETMEQLNTAVQENETMEVS